MKYFALVFFVFVMALGCESEMKAPEKQPQMKAPEKQPQMKAPEKQPQMKLQKNSLRRNYLKN